MRGVAVIDIGKTNAKLALVDPASGAELAVITRSNTVRPGPPWPHFDTAGLWDFFLAGLRDLAARAEVTALSITTHGAAAALLTATGDLACPVLDYEHPGPDAMSGAYDAIRPPFAQTGSPRLPMGLNVGAQLHWMLATDPALRNRVAHVVMWPQYWAFRLTGQVAADLSSLGCHTDLWNPWERRFSDLVDRLGLTGRMAPPRRPDHVLGGLLPAVAAATGLRAGLPVACGIHDSNASLVPHLGAQQAPFAVVSTGTWVVTMAVGGRPVTLNPARDTLVNVNARGEPVPSARFMGGREYELAAGRPGTAAADDMAAVVARGIFLLPSLVAGSGPFPDRQAAWHGPAPTPPQHEAALSAYLALMTATCLDMTGAAGPVLVEGPFSANAPYLAMLAAATGRGVIPSPSRTGTAAGAAMLIVPPVTAGPTVEPTADPPGRAVAPDAGLAAYADRWRALLGISPLPA